MSYGECANAVPVGSRQLGGRCSGTAVDVSASTCSNELAAGLQPGEHWYEEIQMPSPGLRPVAELF